MKGFFSFIATPAGRAVRIIAGLVLVLVGWFVLTGAWGWVVAIIGLVPLLAGIFDRCVFAPLFGLPFVGERLRDAVRS